MVVERIGPIEKDGKTQGGGVSFNYQKWDDVLPALNRATAVVGIAVLPKITEVLWREPHPSRAGWVWVGVKVEVELAYGQERISASTVGEAHDNSDKAIQKAFTQAVKHLYLKLFMIPSHMDEDSDGIPPEAAEGLRPPTKSAEPKPQAGPSKEEIEKGSKAFVIATIKDLPDASQEAAKELHTCAVTKHGAEAPFTAIALCIRAKRSNYPEYPNSIRQIIGDL